MKHHNKYWQRIIFGMIVILLLNIMFQIFAFIFSRVVIDLADFEKKKYTLTR